MLFWPYVQLFKAPNVVRCERDMELDGCKELLASPSFSSHHQDKTEQEPSVEFSEELGDLEPELSVESSEELGDPEPARELLLEMKEQLVPEQQGLVSQTASLVSKLDTLDHGLVSRLPGCYPLVMPFVSSVTSAMWRLASTGAAAHTRTSTTGLAANVSFEALADFSLFISVVETVDQINDAMERSHNYSGCGKKAILGMVGSYLGVSLDKDLALAECEAREALPGCWDRFQDYLANNSATGEQFEYDNITVDSIFFNYEDYSLTVGDYNLTLESFDLEYNITETAYARIEELTGLTNSAAEYKDVMVTKLRSQYGEMMELRSVASEQGMPLALYSPSMETVDMLRSRRMMGDREREPCRERGPCREREDTTLAPEELEDECKTVTAANVQECWEATVNRYFERVDKEYINSFLATADLSLISYSPSMMVALAQGVQMLSLGVFILAAPTLSMIYGDSAAENPVSRLPCLYDIIMQADLQFDSDSLKPSHGSSLSLDRSPVGSLMQSIIRPFGRDNFSTLPLRLLNATSLFSQPKVLVQGLTNITAAMVEKLSSVVEEGEVAETIAQRSAGMRDWLLGVQVLDVMEAATDFFREVMRACWSLRSGHSSGIVAVLEQLVQEVLGTRFWEGLSQIMATVAWARWDMVDSFMTWGVEPVVTGFVELLEWLAEDPAARLATVAQSVRDCDNRTASHLTAISMGSALRDTVCQEDSGPEDVLPGLYQGLIHRLAAAEPSFMLLWPLSVSAMFPMSPGSELSQALETSGLRETWLAVHSPLLRMKRSLLCHSLPSPDRRAHV